DGDIALEHAEVDARDGEPGTDLLRAVGEDGRDLRVLRRRDGDGVGVDDPGLLVGDVLDRVPEEVLVVDTDRGDDGDVRVDDIGRVPGAAHADLDDGDVDRGVREGG